MGRVNLSPSKLKTFQDYYREAYNGYITLDKLIESIKGESKWTPQATIGSGFHLALEEGPDKFYVKDRGMYYLKDGQMPEGLWFTEDQMNLARAFRERYPRMVYETWFNYYTNIDGLPVKINMRTDGLLGAQVHEQKTCRGYFDFKTYYDSIQWRIYILATQSPFVQYNIFQIVEGDSRSDPSHTLKFEYDTFRLYPYPRLKADVDSVIRHYLRTVEELGLMSYLIK